MFLINYIFDCQIVNSLENPLSRFMTWSKDQIKRLSMDVDYIQ